MFDTVCKDKPNFLFPNGIPTVFLLFSPTNRVSFGKRGPFSEDAFHLMVADACTYPFSAAIKAECDYPRCSFSQAAENITSDRTAGSLANPLSMPQSWITPLKRITVVSTPASSRLRPSASP